MAMKGMRVSKLKFNMYVSVFLPLFFFEVCNVHLGFWHLDCEWIVFSQWGGQCFLLTYDCFWPWPPLYPLPHLTTFLAFAFHLHLGRLDLHHLCLRCLTFKAFAFTFIFVAITSPLLRLPSTWQTSNVGVERGVI